MVSVLGFLGPARVRSTPGCIAGNAAARRRPLHARPGSAPPRDPRVSSLPGRTRAVDGTAAPRPAARPGDPGRSAHRAGTSPSLRHRRFRSSESSLQKKSNRRATTTRLRKRELVLWSLPTGWLLPTGWRAVYLTPMVDTTNIGPLADFYLSEGQRLAHMGSWAFDAAGFKHWSPELFAIHGLDPAGQAPSLPEYMVLVHPEDREFVTQEIEKMLADHHGFDFTKRIVRPDGTIRHVRCVGVPAAHGEGEGEGFVGTGIDVTEQEQLTAALRKSEVELRQILDLAPQIIGVLGPSRERLYANRVALTYYGVTLDEWLQRSFGPEVHPDDFDRVKTLVDRSVAHPAAYELEMRLRRGDGTYRWFLVRYNPLRDDQGRLIRWYLACSDIDDRRRAEDRMRNETIALREDLDRASMFEEIVGSSPALQRVGSSHPIAVDVRVLAATNRDLEAAVERGTFREDLFYRLNVFPIRLPPLRERADDIPILVEYLVDRFAKQAGKTIRNIEKQTMQRLTAYDWPGNVRELQNVIERAVVLSERGGETLVIDESWLAGKQRKPSNGTAGPSLADGEKALIVAALQETHGRVAGPRGAAAKLRIPRQTLEWKIRNLNIDKLAFQRPR